MTAAWPRSHHQYPAEEVPVGHLADGTPYYAPLGTLTYDAGLDRVCCHVCGAWLRWINHTHLASHGWSRTSYVEAFGLLRRRALHTPTRAARGADRMRRRIASDERVRRGMAQGQALARSGELQQLHRPGHPGGGAPLELRQRIRQGATVTSAARMAQTREHAEQRAIDWGFGSLDEYLGDRFAHGWSQTRMTNELGVCRPRLRHWLIEAGLEPDDGNLSTDERRRAARARLRARDEQALAQARGFVDFVSYWHARRTKGWPLSAIARDLQRSTQWLRGALGRIEGRPRCEPNESREVVRRGHEQALAERCGYLDFAAYWKARRSAGSTPRDIARELGHGPAWAQKRLERYEGRLVLTVEERRSKRSAATSAKNAAHGDKIRAMATERALDRGFPTLSAYLMDRRRHGRGRVIIANELGIPQSTARRWLSDA